MHNPQIHLGDSKHESTKPHRDCPICTDSLGKLLQSFFIREYAPPSCTGGYAQDSPTGLLWLIKTYWRKCQQTAATLPASWISSFDYTTIIHLTILQFFIRLYYNSSFDYTTISSFDYTTILHSTILQWIVAVPTMNRCTAYNDSLQCLQWIVVLPTMKRCKCYKESL